MFLVYSGVTLIRNFFGPVPNRLLSDFNIENVTFYIFNDVIITFFEKKIFFSVDFSKTNFVSKIAYSPGPSFKM